MPVIGLQISNDLAAHGFTVLVGSRNFEKGKKAALNVIMLAFAIELESTSIMINAVCQGFTATDLNNLEGTGTVQQEAVIRLALFFLMRAVLQARFRMRGINFHGDVGSLSLILKKIIIHFSIITEGVSYTNGIYKTRKVWLGCFRTMSWKHELWNT